MKKTLLFGGSGFFGPVILSKNPEIISVGRTLPPKECKNKHIQLNNLDEINKLTTQLGIFYQVNKEEGENYSVNHSAAVIMINKNAEFHAVFSAPHSTENFVTDLPKIMARN